MGARKQAVVLTWVHASKLLYLIAIHANARHTRHVWVFWYHVGALLAFPLHVVSRVAILCGFGIA